MKARQLIDGASFGPEALKAVGAAFDAAWERIKGNFGDDPVTVEGARLALANALLSVASEDSRDVAVLTRAALDMMAISYPNRALRRRPPVRLDEQEAFWLSRAAETRTLASAAEDPETCRILTEIARAYERLAER